MACFQHLGDVPAALKVFAPVAADVLHFAEIEAGAVGAVADAIQLVGQLAHVRGTAGENIVQPAAIGGDHRGHVIFALHAALDFEGGNARLHQLFQKGHAIQISRTQQRHTVVGFFQGEIFPGTGLLH